MGGTPSMLYSGAMEAAAGVLVGSAVSSVTSTYKMQEGLDETLYSLKQELLKIQCAINAARRRRITDRQLLEWLASLIAAFHLGNYYQRTFKSQSSHPPMIASEGTSNLAILPFYRPAKYRRTMEKLIFGDKELKEINDALRMLRSIDTCAFILMVNALPERPLRTYLYMDHNRLLNRDKERDQIMNFLFLPSTDGENNVGILPLVGPSEVGKTSLVLHCFHDPKVQDYFSLKIYDGYSNIAYPDFWDTNIFDKCTDENTMIAMLKQKLSSERFLLVMDDVWRVDLTIWNALLKCHRCGKKGSKIIMIVDSCAYNILYKKFTMVGMVKPIIFAPTSIPSILNQMQSKIITH